MKRTSTYFILATIFLGTLIFTSCEKEIVYPEPHVDTNVYHPGTHFTLREWSDLTEELNMPEEAFDYSVTGTNNSNKQYYLGTFGRALFYDNNLSTDGLVSCASCHQQKLGFSDDVDFSIGTHGELTKRNSIALGGFTELGGHYGGSASTGFTTVPFFWDERQRNFNDQLQETIENPDEMGIDMDDLQWLIENKRHYKVLREKAFPNTEPFHGQAIQALKQFVSSINSRNSKFDKAAPESKFKPNFVKHFENFTSEENQGKSIFIAHCSSCHEKPTFDVIRQDFSFQSSKANNGLDLIYADKGVATHTHYNKDDGVFKIPGLKNISITAPYMHDGRFETLEEVVDFYNEGIQNHENLDERLKSDGEIMQMNLSANEKAALISFLKTLTDEEMLVHEKWSDPFKR